MSKEQIEKVIQDTFTEFKGSDRGAMVLACRQLFNTYYTPLDASHRELVGVTKQLVYKLEQYLHYDNFYGRNYPESNKTIINNAKKLIGNETE